MAALVQQHSTVGSAANSKTETFSACTAGNVMVIVATTNENAGADNINTPSGWTVLKTFRVGTTTLNMTVFGKVSVGGETSQVVTSSVAQRFQTWFGEISGVTLVVGGSSTNGSTTNNNAGSTGSISSVPATAFYLGACAVKQASAPTGSAGYTAATVNNEGGTISTQKVTLAVVYDPTPPTPAIVTWSWGTTAQWASLGLWLTAASGTAYTQGVSGALSFVGAAPKKASTRRVTGAVSFAGSRTASPTGRLVAGVFAPVGVLTPNSILLRTLSGALSFAGALSSAAVRLRSLVGASLSFSGAQSRVKAVSQAVSGALSFSGAQAPRGVGKALSGVFAPVGSVAKMQTLARTLVGAGFFPVSVISRVANRSRTFTAAVSFVGMLASSSRGALTASLSFVGNVLHPTLRGRTLSGSFAPVGGFSARSVTRLLFGALQAAGVLHTAYLPPAGPTPPGGGGFGALMSDSFFQRYEVSEKWRHMKRVRVK